MIYIDNFCEFMRLLSMINRGVFTPQNKELVSTTELVVEIAENTNKKIFY